MKAKRSSKKNNMARGVSLPPDMARAAMERAGTMDITFSKYVQRLIRADIQFHQLPAPRQ